jgi:hypothetical protein
MTDAREGALAEARAALILAAQRRELAAVEALRAKRNEAANADLVREGVGVELFRAQQHLASLQAAAEEEEAAASTAAAAHAAAEARLEEATRVHAEQAAATDAAVSEARALRGCFQAVSSRLTEPASARAPADSLRARASGAAAAAAG